MKFEIEVTEEDLKKALVDNEIRDEIRRELRHTYWGDREVKKIVKEAIKDRIAEVLDGLDWWNAEHIQKMAAESLERRVMSAIKENLK